MSQEPSSDAEPHDEDEVMDPEDLYTFEEFLTGKDLLEEMQLEVVAELKPALKRLKKEGDATVDQGDICQGLVKKQINVLWMIILRKILSTILQYFVEGLG
jgi:hypothetical protein